MRSILQKNCCITLAADNVLNAKQAFLDDLVAVLMTRSPEPGNIPKLDYFLTLFDNLWKEMTIEARWFGSEMPSLEEYKHNREVTITVHPFVEMYRELRFPTIDANIVRDLVSLVAQIIYYDNDLCSKHDEIHGKPNLISLLMVQKGINLETARIELRRERDALYAAFQKGKELSYHTSVEPFSRFLDQCIEGNMQTLNSHQERYATAI